MGCGGGTHRSWPGGRVDQGPWLQERVGGGRGGLVGCFPGEGWLAWQFHRRGQGLGGESKGFGSGRLGVLVREGLAWRGKGSGGGSKGFGSGAGRW